MKRELKFPEGMDDSLKFGCGRYVQEEHLLERCAPEILRFGSHPLFVCNEQTYGVAFEKVAASLRAAGVEPKVFKWGGFCCRECAIEEVKKGCLEGVDVVLGCGGGLIMDFSKLLAELGNLPIVTIPTSSSTCASYTPLSTCYTAEGRYVSTTFYRHELSAALLDMTILSQQPQRLLVAGACDAMAKKLEMEFWNDVPGVGANAAAQAIAVTVADLVYKGLDENLDAACRDLAKGEPTDLLKEVVFNSVVGAGVVSGISKGARQTAIAHLFYFYLRQFFTAEALKYTHGELVAAGLVAQLAYNGRPDEAEKFAARLHGWGLKASMTDFGLPHGETELEQCVGYMYTQPELKAAGERQRDRLREALKAVMR